MRIPKQSARNVIALLTGFGPFMKHFYQMDQNFYKTDKCRVCKEGGSVECPLHFIFECEALKWDREKIFGQLWPEPCDRPTKVSLTHKNGSKAQANRPQANNAIIRPANNVLAGLACQTGASQAGNSSFNMPHPSSSLFSWTVKQIQEFVSVDSFLEVYVLQQIGNANLESRNASLGVQAAQL